MTESELKQKIDAIEAGPGIIAAAVSGLDAKTLDFKPSPEKWSVRQMVAHLADIDILYGYRLRQMIADRQPVIAPVDQDDWAQGLGYAEADVAQCLEQYRATRRGNVRLLRRLKVSDLGRGAYHPEHNRLVTVEDVIGMMAGHDPNHLGQIERLKRAAAGAAAAG